MPSINQSINQSIKKQIYDGTKCRRQKSTGKTGNHHRGGVVELHRRPGVMGISYSLAETTTSATRPCILLLLIGCQLYGLQLPMYPDLDCPRSQEDQSESGSNWCNVTLKVDKVITAMARRPHILCSIRVRSFRAFGESCTIVQDINSEPEIVLPFSSIFSRLATI